MFATAVGITTALLQGEVTVREKADVPVKVVTTTPFSVADVN